MDSMNDEDLFGAFGLSSTSNGTAKSVHTRFKDSSSSSESCEEGELDEVGSKIEENHVEIDKPDVIAKEENCELSIDSKLDNFLRNHAAEGVVANATLASKISALLQISSQLIDENQHLKEQLAAMPAQDSLFAVDKRFANVATFDSTFLDETGAGTTSKSASSGPACFNCGENHLLSECLEPRDQAKISLNKRAHMRQSRDRENKNNKRYGAEEKYKPGIIGEDLKKALGLGPNDLPYWIYQMRKIGYPPGYLKDAYHAPSNIKIMDDDGGNPVESKNGIKPKGYYSVDKIVEYPGFNVDPGEDIEDNSAALRALPMQANQKKEVFAAFLKSLIPEESENSVVQNSSGSAIPGENMDVANGCTEDDDSLQVIDEISEDIEELNGLKNAGDLGQTPEIPLTPHAGAPGMSTPSLNREHSALSLSVVLGTPISLTSTFHDGSGDSAGFSGTPRYVKKPALAAFGVGVNNFEVSEEIPPTLEGGYQRLMKILEKKGVASFQDPLLKVRWPLAKIFFACATIWFIGIDFFTQFF